MDLSSALEKEKPTVNVLLEAWQATSEWESQMARRYNQPVSNLPKESKRENCTQSRLKQIEQILGLSTQTISSALATHFHVFTEAQDASVGYTFQTTLELTMSSTMQRVVGNAFRLQRL
jgi:hypothetical protein